MCRQSISPPRRQPQESSSTGSTWRSMPHHGLQKENAPDDATTGSSSKPREEQTPSSSSLQARVVHFATHTQVREYGTVYGSNYDVSFPLELGWQVLEESMQPLKSQEQEQQQRPLTIKTTRQERASRLQHVSGYSISDLIRLERRRKMMAGLVWSSTDRCCFTNGRYPTPAPALLHRILV